ncbi:MAG: efflux RND transporter periplasmic adaptor subunit [Acidobacteria bacterium]|nr:efflux RND transporter periplasmic adaptor subunit [Acidobacteriota bacterium]
MKRSALFLLMGWGIWSCSSSQIPAKAFTLEAQTFEIRIEGQGSLRPVKTTPIQVPPSRRGPKNIAWLAPNGQPVKAGEKLVLFDSLDLSRQEVEYLRDLENTALEIAIRRGELGSESLGIHNQLDLVRLEKDQAEQFAARDETLYSRMEILDSEADIHYLTAKEDHFSHKADEHSQKTETETQILDLKKNSQALKLEQVQSQLKELELLAPHDGIFIYTPNWSGQDPFVGMMAWGGMQLGELPDNSAFEALVYVRESEAGGLVEGLTVSLTAPSQPGVVLSGKVTRIDALAKPLEKDSPIKYFEVVVSLDTPFADWMATGVRVEATLFVEQIPQTFAVPNQAVFHEKDSDFVWVKSSSGPQKRPVELGKRSTTLTQITSGLNEGDQLYLESMSGGGS